MLIVVSSSSAHKGQKPSAVPPFSVKATRLSVFIKSFLLAFSIQYLVCPSVLYFINLNIIRCDIKFITHSSFVFSFRFVLFHIFCTCCRIIKHACILQHFSTCFIVTVQQIMKLSALVL